MPTHLLDQPEAMLDGSEHQITNVSPLLEDGVDTPVAVTPSPIDQNSCAHWRNPMDMMRQG
jgi:hypothetical protein